LVVACLMVLVYIHFTGLYSEGLDAMLVAPPMRGEAAASNEPAAAAAVVVSSRKSAATAPPAGIAGGLQTAT